MADYSVFRFELKVTFRHIAGRAGHGPPAPIFETMTKIHLTMKKKLSITSLWLL